MVREEIKRREDNNKPVLERGEMTENFIRNWLIANESLKGKALDDGAATTLVLNGDVPLIRTDTARALAQPNIIS